MTLRQPGCVGLPPLSTLRIPWLRTAAADANAAAAELLALFPDHDPKLLEEDTTGWTFGLDWPSHLLAHTDPDLPTFARRDYGLSLKELATYSEVRRCGRAEFVFSMFHSRALLAPVLAAARHDGRLPGAIVHVDAHSDLGPSLLAPVGPCALRNVAFQIDCRLDHPESVLEAIAAGLIHKGNFLTAFLLAAPPGELFHVREDAIPHTGFLIPGALPSQKAGTFPQVALVPGTGPTAWRHHGTMGLPDEVPGEEGVWLDVDLDAFCNRFDGDSDRRGWRGSAAEKDTLQRRLHDFLRQLSAAPWLGAVHAVSVAASPGFFPSGYWCEVIPELCNGLDALLSA